MWSLVSLGPVKELLYAASLHPSIEAHGLQHPSYDGLQDLGYDVADDQDYQCAYELRDVAQEKPYCILQRLKYPSLRLILHQQNHLCSPFSALPLFSIKLAALPRWLP